MNWEKVKLSALCDGVQYGYTASSTGEPTGVRFLRITDIVPSMIDWDAVPYCEIEEGELNKYSLEEGDIVIARTGATVGYAKYIGPNIPKSVFASYLIRLKLNNCVDKRFLGFLIESDSYKDYINIIAGGAAQPNANAQDLISFQLFLPPLSIQRRIAEVLGRYDALIENYQRQIGLLEAMAQNLYREWFVRGRCPYAQAGELLDGWEEMTLGEIAIDARRIVKIEDVEPNTPYVGLEHLSIKSIVIRDCGVVEDVDSDKLAFEPYDILFGKIRPYLHKVCLSHFGGVCSSDAIVIKPKIENALGFLMFTVFDERFIDFADKISNGTKMPRAEWSVLQTYPVLIPSREVLERFDHIVKPIFAKLGNLQSQITQLRQMRDKLLPRLMSGQLAPASSGAECL